MRWTLLTTPLGILILLKTLAGPVLASQPPGSDAPDNTESVTQDTREHVPAAAPVSGELRYSRFHKVLARNLTTNLFSQKNLIPFIIGSAGALAIAPADQEISDSLRGNAPEAGTAGNYIGEAGMAAFVGGSVLASRFTKSTHFREFSYTLAQAYATNNIWKYALKYATNRTRPDKSDSFSFPSGHTSDSFAVSTIVWRYYGMKWGIPMYVVSSFVGFARIESGRHWASDTVAGAALGIICANTAFIGTKRELAGKKIAGLLVSPIHDRDRRGISIRLSY
jgi:hypothetical protein